MRTAGKLGKAPARPRPKDIQLSEIIGRGFVLPEATVGFGHWEIIPSGGWGMLGNDQYGDCVFAGGDHETMMVNAMNQRSVAFTDKNALADYSAVTGFNPSDPNSDNGTDMHAAMDYRRATGLVDEAGNRHKIGAYVSLEPGNFRQTLEALHAFDFVAIGFEFPDYAMQQFSAGKPWAFQKGGTIEGGHYVPIVGRPHAWTLDVVTWGQVQPMGRKFFETYCDEAFGVITPETLSQGGVTPEGLDIGQLQQALAAL